VIGVLTDAADVDVAREFFELFKTPWEVAVPGRPYSAVVTVNRPATDVDAPVIVAYNGRAEESAGKKAVGPGPQLMQWGESTIPVYGPLATFDGDSTPGPVLTAEGKPVLRCGAVGAQVVWHVGYDLFREVRHLLSVGQPAASAHSASLDLHVDVLRSLLLEADVPFLEVPPRPDGVDFICCLTHDIDFVGLRRQGLFNKTVAGFLWRASFGTARDVLGGRRRLADAARNWRAVLSLPLIWAGWIRDPWEPFEDYAGVEDPRHSTFFIVPFSNRPGVAPDGTVDATRAVRYQVEDIVPALRRARSAGSEVGVHGIDAWRSVEAGREEKRRLTDPVGQGSAGIRMHWLYFDPESPKTLESAGFEYDSTCGFNETIGFRAGTLQAFRPFGCDRLLELPLSIMDSALFSEGRLGVDENEAAQLCDRVVAQARRFGGALVVNWHCRSLAPERLWGRFYLRLLANLRAGHVWFATAGAAVEWFKWRRAIRFERAASDPLGVRVSAPTWAEHPGVILMHQAGESRRSTTRRTFDGRVPIELHLNKQPLILEAS
jgi:hypothetical protein